MRRMSLLICPSILLFSQLAEGRITMLVVTSTQSPAFQGGVFKSGQYQLANAVAHGELDPSDPLNSIIVNLDRAPRNVRGNVEYTVDVRILAPMDLTKGSRTILADIPNRGDMRALGVLNDAPTTNTPLLATDAGNGFLMDQGYSIVWIGWQGDVGAGANRLTATLPVAKNADGSSIVDSAREEYVDTGTTPTFLANLTYPAAVQSGSLTVRENERDPRQVPPDLTFTWLTEKQIKVNRPAGFDSGAIYEFIYQAKDPIVMGIGFAATRDVVSLLRHEAADDSGNANPLALNGHPFMKYTLAFGISQSGRYLRDFIYQGFNEDERHRRVFDGINPHLAGSRKTFTNYAFSQPSRFSRQHEDHLFPGDQFPFTYTFTHDQISHRGDGILLRCHLAGTYPKVIQTDSESELWQGRASLVVTNTSGQPVPIPENVRVFLFMGAQHVPVATSVRGICQSPSNTLPYSAELRALNVDLAQWVRGGTEPPESRYPTMQKGELAPAAAIKFPAIPGTHFNSRDNQLPLKILTQQPPMTGPLYPVFQAIVDADGIRNRRRSSPVPFSADGHPLRVERSIGGQCHRRTRQRVPENHHRSPCGRHGPDGFGNTLREDQERAPRQRRSAALTRGAVQEPRRLCEQSAPRRAETPS
jgi:hypothetical protein